MPRSVARCATPVAHQQPRSEPRRTWLWAVLMAWLWHMRNVYASKRCPDVVIRVVGLSPRLPEETVCSNPETRVGRFAPVGEPKAASTSESCTRPRVQSPSNQSGADQLAGLEQASPTESARRRLIRANGFCARKRPGRGAAMTVNVRSPRPQAPKTRTRRAPFSANSRDARACRIRSAGSSKSAGPS